MRLIDMQGYKHSVVDVIRIKNESVDASVGAAGDKHFDTRCKRFFRPGFFYVLLASFRCCKHGP